jgi:hypothetical protein
VEVWARPGAPGVGDLTEETSGTATVAGCETAAKAEDVDSRCADVELSPGRNNEGEDWTESEVGTDGAVDDEDVCVLVSGPSFFADFGKIRLNHSRLPFLGAKLIADVGRAGGMGQRQAK